MRISPHLACTSIRLEAIFQCAAFSILTRSVSLRPSQRLCIARVFFFALVVLYRDDHRVWAPCRSFATFFRIVSIQANRSRVGFRRHFAGARASTGTTNVAPFLIRSLTRPTTSPGAPHVLGRRDFKVVSDTTGDMYAPSKKRRLGHSLVFHDGEGRSRFAAAARCSNLSGFSGKAAAIAAGYRRVRISE